MAENIRQLLADFLSAQRVGAGLRILDLQRIGVGRSRQNWIFDLVVSRAGEEYREPLILRRDPEGGLVETDRTIEFKVLRALEASDVPTPKARWLDAHGAWLGKPSLIMCREPGECDYLVLNGERPAVVRVQLAHEFCDLLAQVHNIDWECLRLNEFLDDPGPDAARRELSNWVAVLRHDQLESHPELDLAIDWFERHAPRSIRTVLVHADFKPGNILLQGDKIVALLDWELAHLGDPLEDIGWVTQPLRAREHLIPGSWELNDLLGRYSNSTGLDVDPIALRWWTAFSSFKTAVMQVSGLRSFLDGRSDEPFRPTRRVLSTLLTATTDTED
ncbi:aminoglycoside phosphotransferase (APT) family kinase protein [Antricoccus suffuscus]|uniref:Aminoglycoside phosphotransferase (APT) family kinase protein n=1 Tax=Antricoccus suffuscus TaxID=1629062 RepID=A0A2T1A146_9ACTN|nr:phosphotransferase family protein [Antricoccus suffuscus]PRZ42329.1 aminoglycoside phosphotransferase (APT) family kinase protein [Antricoccus suffuscus]